MKMPNICCARNCCQRGGFTFPKNNELYYQWRNAVQRELPHDSLWEPTPYSVLCHQHFKNDDFIVSPFNRIKRVLRPNAVPSIFHIEVKQVAGEEG